MNVGKTIVIPAVKDLDDRTINRYRGYINTTTWNNLPIGTQGKYLGYMLGPGVDLHKVYMEIVDKMNMRLKQWEDRNMSFADRIAIWNIFVFSKLGYVNQLYPMEPGVHEAVDKSLLKWMGGPHGWINKETLGRLQTRLGFCRAPRRFAQHNLASRARVRHNMSDEVRVRVLAEMRSRRHGINPGDFSNSTAWSILFCDAQLGQLRLDRYEMAGEIIGRITDKKNCKVYSTTR